MLIETQNTSAEIMTRKWRSRQKGRRVPVNTSLLWNLHWNRGYSGMDNGTFHMQVITFLPCFIAFYLWIILFPKERESIYAFRAHFYQGKDLSPIYVTVNKFSSLTAAKSATSPHQVTKPKSMRHSCLCCRFNAPLASDHHRCWKDKCFSQWQLHCAASFFHRKVWYHGQQMQSNCLTNRRYGYWACIIDHYRCFTANKMLQGTPGKHSAHVLKKTPHVKM